VVRRTTVGVRAVDQPRRIQDRAPEGVVVAEHGDMQTVHEASLLDPAVVGGLDARLLLSNHK
jgi:hypothetical protein